MKFKFSARERWIVALAPALAAGVIYYYLLADGYAAELDKQEKRVAAAGAPLAAPAAAPTLARAKAALGDLKKNIAQREARVLQLEERLAAAPKNCEHTAALRDPAHVIGKVEAVFARHGLTPLLSAADCDCQAPAALVSLLTDGADAAGRKGARVWHCVFENQLTAFEHALKDLTKEAPGVVPLSLNFVYNPDNDGETRLLELWLIY